MTVLEFLSDRLGRLVLWGSCTALAAGILLATGTSPGVLILLLAALFLVFVVAQAQAFRRMRRTRNISSQSVPPSPNGSMSASCWT